MMTRIRFALFFAAVGVAVAAGNNPTNRSFCDAFASLMFDDVDSFKELSGTDAATLRISTAPRPA